MIGRKNRMKEFINCEEIKTKYIKKSGRFFMSNIHKNYQ